MDPVPYDLTSHETLRYLHYPVASTNDENNGSQIIQKLSITLLSIILILGIMGNGLVIWIAGFKMKKTISAVWFLNLAIADFLCCLFLPLNIARWANIDLCSPFSTIVFCSLDIFLFSINMSASVLLLTAMSVDRWVSVMWPFWAKVHRTQKLVRITVGIIWGLSLVLSVLMSFLLELLLMDSLISFSSQDRKINPELLWLFVLFVIPFLIISTSYVSIYLKLRKSNRPQRSQGPYRIITAVILCFFICWAPYYVWPHIDWFHQGGFQTHIVDVITIILAYLNSCINPIIYVIMGQDFRHSFLRSIPFRIEKALSEEEQDDCEPAPSTDV
ncbi:C3a anaphylatoxin chemotactic receptor-like [Engystomops pustulosus]|uniref:C3a anaphylatoxin chemotactic receptor-like n=1 Tax=Engystomops pustulosus TaxID=76066 RepID=UPI003AFA6FF6